MFFLKGSIKEIKWEIRIPALFQYIGKRTQNLNQNGKSHIERKEHLWPDFRESWECEKQSPWACICPGATVGVNRSGETYGKTPDLNDFFKCRY